MSNVIIYSTKACAFCKTEKQWLDSLGVKYTSKMVDEDASAMDELTALNVGSAVPVTVIDGKIIRGFNRPAIQSALAAE